MRIKYKKHLFVLNVDNKNLQNEMNKFRNENYLNNKKNKMKENEGK